MARRRWRNRILSGKAPRVTLLVDELRFGEQFDLRGPSVGISAWKASLRGPLLLVAGRSGITQAIFPFDMTLAQATCTNGGTTNAIGAAAVYRHGMGTVLHCPSCESVLIRAAQAKGRNFLDMWGVRILQISVEAWSFFMRLLRPWRIESARR